MYVYIYIGMHAFICALIAFHLLRMENAPMDDGSASEDQHDVSNKAS